MAAELLEMLVYASWGLCCIGMCINPVTNTRVAKAGFSKQEAPQLELITTSVYPVGLENLANTCWEEQIVRIGRN